MSDNSSMQSARHAQVVPAFAVNYLRRSLPNVGEAVRPDELLRWQRPGDLTESARENLRKIIVRRLRHIADKLWAEKVGIQLKDDWRDHLIPMDQKRIELLKITNESPLEERTLREVKSVLRMPLEPLLGLLSRVEAIGWVPPAPVALSDRGSVTSALPTLVRVTPELRELAEKALKLPWLAKVVILPPYFRTRAIRNVAPARSEQDAVGQRDAA